MAKDKKWFHSLEVAEVVPLANGTANWTLDEPFSFQIILLALSRPDIAWIDLNRNVYIKSLSFLMSQYFAEEGKLIRNCKNKAESSRERDITPTEWELRLC